MSFRRKTIHAKSTAALLAVLLFCVSPLLGQVPASAGKNVPLIWSDPGDVKSKDLVNGPGGEEHRPQLPVKFVKEDSGGHNSKFDVEDSKGTKWKAKLGIEAQPEIVATRLLWAVGYFTNENYFVPNLEVKELPAHLHRGQGHVTSPNHVEKVRLQNSFEGKKTANWSWRHNSLIGKREFNGLRVMMALLVFFFNDTATTEIYTDRAGTERYLVTDVGTAFGASGNRWTEAQSKNNLKAYRSTKFITKVTPTYVDFSFPRFPPFLFIFDLPHYVHQVRLRWIGNRVPREDAKWVGSLLGQLSQKQITDAFLAAGYSQEDASAFTAAVQSRIAELNRL